MQYVSQQGNQSLPPRQVRVSETMGQALKVEATENIAPADEAVAAWLKVRHARSYPTAVEALKLGRRPTFRLHGAGPNASAVIAKARSREVIAREYSIYERILRTLPGALSCLGCIEIGEAAWLFLEDAGVERYDPSSQHHRTLAGEWLAAAHLASARSSDMTDVRARSTEDYLEQLHLVRDAIERSKRHPAMIPDAALLRALIVALDAAEALWPQVVSACAGSPMTLVHGDFASHNLRIGVAGDKKVLAVFDWEQGGWGTPAADLAQSSSRPGAIAADADLEAYCTASGHRVGGSRRDDILRLAAAGSVLRCLVAIGWETRWLRIVVGDGLHASHAVNHCRANFGVYCTELEAATRGLTRNGQ